MLQLQTAPAEFGDAWYQFMNPEADQPNMLRVRLGDDHFPIHPSGRPIVVDSVELVAAVDSNAPSALLLSVDLNTKRNVSFTLRAGSGPADLRSQE